MAKNYHFKGNNFQKAGAFGIFCGFRQIYQICSTKQPEYIKVKGLQKGGKFPVNLSFYVFDSFK